MQRTQAGMVLAAVAVAIMDQMAFLSIVMVMEAKAVQLEVEAVAEHIVQELRAKPEALVLLESCGGQIVLSLVTQLKIDKL